MSKPLRILICIRAPVARGSEASTRFGALDGVMQLVEEQPSAKVSTLALDEAGAENALRTCLAHIADSAFLARGPAVDAADEVAAGCLMAEAVQTIEHRDGSFDLIFCSDSDFGQGGLGPALAECLDRPQVTGAIGVTLDGQHFLVTQRQEDGLAKIRAELPGVVSFIGGSTPARYPQLSRLMAANEATLQVVQTSAVPPSWKPAVFFEQPRTKQVLAFHEENAIPMLVELLRQTLVI